MSPRELAKLYPLIEENIAPQIPKEFSVGESFCDSRDVRRFFRRTGVISGRGTKASGTILSVISAITKGGVDESRAKAVLAAYCASGGEISGICASEPQCGICAIAGECAFHQRRPSIKNMPESERPRERLLAVGQQNLTDAELLAIIIGGGTQEESAIELARKLLTKFENLKNIAACSPAELSTVRGIGFARAASIKAALELAKRINEQAPAQKAGAFLNPSKVYDRYRGKIGGEKREMFYVMLLDTKNKLIRDVRISVGSLSQSIVHPREAFEPAVRDSAASVIFIHNHPSGDTTPSREDIDITKRLRQTGEVLGIRVLDHIIVSESGYTSLANTGQIGD